MTYKVLLAVGDRIIERKVTGAVGVVVSENIYIMRDTTGAVIFSAPADSVIYIQQD